MSHRISQWTTISQNEPPHLTMRHCISQWARISHNEPPHLTMSHHISKWATPSRNAPPHLTMSQHVSQWATASHNEPPHLKMSHPIPQWATTSHSGPPHLAKLYPSIGLWDSDCPAELFSDTVSISRGYSRIEKTRHAVSLIVRMQSSKPRSQFDSPKWGIHKCFRQGESSLRTLLT